MKDTIHRLIEKRLFSATIVPVFLLCTLALGAHAQGARAQSVPNQQELIVLPAAAPHAFVYWTNYTNGSIGRATITGTGVNEGFIASTSGGATGGSGLTMNSRYVYWTTANGGSATNIARATLAGREVNTAFITGAQNPCGIAVDKSYIYWAGDVGTSIGRASLNGSNVNQAFISTGNGVCGVAVNGSYVYWANYRTNEIGRANLDGSGVNNSFISGSSSGIAINGTYIYFVTSAGTGIGRANLDGTNVNLNFISGLNGQVAFLASDLNYIFWADWGSRGSGTTIGRAKLNGTNVNQSFIQGTAGGFGIAVTGGDP